MTEATDANAAADATSTLPSHQIEYVVEGEDIDPQVLEEPGWLKIRRKLTLTSTTTTNGAGTTAHSNPDQTSGRKSRQRRQRKPHPPENPLPENDVKVVIRPQGGLDLTTVNVATLADILQDQAKLPRHAGDQVRLHYRSSFIVVSTPNEDRAQRYLELPALNWKGTTYTLASHIPPPSDTAVGALFTVASP